MIGHTMTKTEFFDTWSQLHGNAPISKVVKAWLQISYVVAKALIKMRLTANFVTILGLLFAILLFLFAHENWSAIFLILSLFADGIDGSIAIISKKNSKFGALLDAIIDKVSELFWILALYKIGVEISYLIFVLVLALIQEYLRSRSSGVGLTELGVVTIAERPVRAIFTFFTLLLSALNIDFFEIPIYFWSVFQMISLITLIRYVKINLI
jgi:CDP-diacylglycerol--glycerol-3-phosphate 3-phosphatidyltransferase